MNESQFTQLDSLVGAMIRAGQAPGTPEMEEVAQSLAKIFGVAPDEVAIFALDEKHKALKFVIPEKLVAVGSIPLTSGHALAVRTWKERKAEFLNNFSTSKKL
jgi:hypothetical protein